MRRPILSALLIGVLLAAPAPDRVASATAGDPIAAVPTTVPVDEPVDEPVTIVVFHGDGCGFCARMLDFLDGLEASTPDVVVERYEVWNDRANARVFVETLAALGEEAVAVPTVVIGDTVWVGYTEPLAASIEDHVDAVLAGRTPAEDPARVVSVPLVGDVDVGDRSLLVATVVIGFVDGVNPCSLWVLSMLMALVLHSGSRARVLVVGGLFLTITSALYGVYMLGAYSALSLVDDLGWIRLTVAFVAAALGVLHLKEHWTARGPSVTIPSERKPGILRRMRRLADTERSLPAVVGGTVVLAAGVSLVETPCTAGLPLLWTNLVTERGVTGAGAAMLFAVYLAVFLLDELLVFGAAVVTMRAMKLQERHGQLLQLLSGTLMVTLAVAMVAAPQLLESVSGTAVVFATAAAACALVVVIERRIDRQRATDRRASRRRAERGRRHAAHRTG